MVSRAALICIDGWGVREEAHGNAILEAKTPVMDGFRDGDEANWAVIAAHGAPVPCHPLLVHHDPNPPRTRAQGWRSVCPMA